MPDGLTKKQENILAIYQESGSITEAADKANVSRGTVYRALKTQEFQDALAVRKDKTQRIGKLTISTIQSILPRIHRHIESLEDNPSDTEMVKLLQTINQLLPVVKTAKELGLDEGETDSEIQESEMDATEDLTKVFSLGFEAGLKGLSEAAATQLTDIITQHFIETGEIITLLDISEPTEGSLQVVTKEETAMTVVEGDSNE